MKKFLLGLLASLTMFVAQAHATLPAEISTAVGDTEDGWDLVRPVMISIGLAFLVWRLIKRGVRSA